MTDVLPIKEQLAKGKLKIARLTVMNFIFCTGFVVSVIYQNRDISLEDIKLNILISKSTFLQFLE